MTPVALAPVAADLKVWRVATVEVADPLGAELMGWLDPDELHRVSGLRTPAMQGDYVVAHAALRLALSRHLGCTPADVDFERLPCLACGEPHGRPVVRGREVEFSLARTTGLAVVAVSTRPVGVDVETLADDETVASVAPLLHAREQREIEAGPDHALMFTRIWTRKEAYLKGLGVGLARDLDLDYLGGAPAPQGVSLNGWWMADLALDEGYVGAVAVGASPAA